MEELLDAAGDDGHVHEDDLAHILEILEDEALDDSLFQSEAQVLLEPVPYEVDLLKNEMVYMHSLRLFII